MNFPLWCLKRKPVQRHRKTLALTWNQKDINWKRTEHSVSILLRTLLCNFSKASPFFAKCVVTCFASCKASMISSVWGVTKKWPCLHNELVSHRFIMATTLMGLLLLLFASSLHNLGGWQSKGLTQFPDRCCYNCTSREVRREWRLLGRPLYVI